MHLQLKKIYGRVIPEYERNNPAKVFFLIERTDIQAESETCVKSLLVHNSNDSVATAVCFEIFVMFTFLVDNNSL